MSFAFFMKLCKNKSIAAFYFVLACLGLCVILLIINGVLRIIFHNLSGWENLNKDKSDA